MGHIRLGRLGKSHSWRRLTALLDLSAPDVESVASTTAEGARQRLLDLRSDPVLGYTFWLLSRVATAARSDTFVDEAGRLGLDVTGDTSALGLIAQVNDLVRIELERHPRSGPFGEIASLALRRALIETIGVVQPSLFGSTLRDLEAALRHQTTDKAFGDLTRRFFGDYLARTLRFYVDKELPFHIGADSGFPDIDTSATFLESLDTYCRQSAVIVEAFASEWLSKHAFHEAGHMSRQQAQGFVAVAMAKLEAELGHEVVA
jgi:hypothetical protein